MEKKTLISDLLHYPISLTALEKAIIATPIFNRLHNVKQNSTAYLTFPSLNHSRFSHSLGAMHLAGELFYKALVNAERVTASTFLQTLMEILDILQKHFDASAFPKLKNKKVPPLSQCEPTPLCSLSPALVTYIPYFLVPSQQFVFLVTYQAVRLVGLVHDLGHPPFSHATEFAISQIQTELVEKNARILH